jgi:hypothetical protein
LEKVSGANVRWTIADHTFLFQASLKLVLSCMT